MISDIGMAWLHNIDYGALHVCIVRDSMLLMIDEGFLAHVIPQPCCAHTSQTQSRQSQWQSMCDKNVYFVSFYGTKHQYVTLYATILYTAMVAPV